MLRERAKLVAFSLYLSDISVLVASFFFAYWLRNTSFISPYGPLSPPTDYLKLLIPMLIIWSLLLYYFGLYRSYRTETIWCEAEKLLKVALFAVAATGLLIFVLKLYFVSRLVILFFGAVAFVGLTTARLTVRTITKAFRRKGYNYRNIVIVGTGQAAKDLIRKVESRSEWGLRLIGIVEEGEGQTSGIQRYSALGSITDISKILQRYVIDEVLIAVSPGHLDKIDIVLSKCRQIGAPARVTVNFFSNAAGSVSLDKLGSIPLLSFTTTPQNQVTLALKRGFDIVISSVALILFAPLCIFIAVGIKLGTPGPAIFTQTRVSLNGRFFEMHKFRSMYLDAEEKKDALRPMNEVEGPAFKLNNDPRVTPLGRLLRKTSLDEIPQLINVLKGDMSIIGPRPPLPEEVRMYEPWQRRRLSMKPGLTGLWQINGRNTIRDFNQWMRLDLHYVDNWSLKLDMEIFLKTIPVIILGRGAH
jgi:exopolysaccharide biosynthesis polyprenyl glycosylphosphotransferase